MSTGRSGRGGIPPLYACVLRVGRGIFGEKSWFGLRAAFGVVECLCDLLLYGKGGCDVDLRPIAFFMRIMKSAGMGGGFGFLHECCYGN